MRLKYKLALTYLFILLSLGFIVSVNCFNLIKDYNIYLTLTVIISILLLMGLKVIVSEIKNKKQLFDKEDSIDEIAAKTSLHIMPFGPALIISAFICIFYLDSIKELIIKFIY